MKQGILFGNKRIVKPGVYSRMDAKGSVGRDYTNQKTVIVIGNSTGGEPEKLVWFDNPQYALKNLRGGDLHKAVSLLCNTSPAGLGEGAGTVGVIRANKATKATADLGTWGTIESLDYGVWNNSIKFKLVKDTTSGGYDAVVYCEEDDRTEYFRGIGLIFRVESDEASAIVDIAKTGTDLIATVKSGALGSEVEHGKVNMNDPKVASLRRFGEYIESLSGGKVRLQLMPEVSSKTATPMLDLGTIKKEQYITSIATETVARIADSGYITLAVKPSKEVDEQADYVKLAGATDGLSETSWAKYFTMASAANCSIIVPLTDNKVIIAEALAHANLMSNEKAKERIVIAGMGDNTTSKEAISLATTLGNARIQLIPQGAYVRLNGSVTKVPAYLVACLQAGRCSFTSNGESNTFSYFPITKLAREYSEEEIEAMLKAGCTLFESTQTGVRMIQDITTYTDSEESLYTERSVIMLSDELNKELRLTLEELQIGKKGLRTTPETVKNAVISFLKGKIRSEEINSYRNVKVTSFNRVITVEYEVAPVEPTNFILVTGHFFTEEAITA